MAIQMKPELYRVFKAVAEALNISAAAEALYISQSAVSQSVKQLEEGLGLTLFRRTPKGVILTTEGQLLFQYALPAMNLLETAEQKLLAVRNLAAGELKIGASDTISRYLLLPRLEQFAGLYPGVKLQIINRTSLEAVALLKSGSIDLAFVNLPVLDNELVLTEFLQVQDIFVASPARCKKACYTLQEVAELPLILLEKKANSRSYVENFFKAEGISISPEIELGSHELLLEFARINLGVSCVIREFSQKQLQVGGLWELPLVTPIPPRAVGVAWLKGVRLSTAARAFMAL